MNNYENLMIKVREYNALKDHTDFVIKMNGKNHWKTIKKLNELEIEIGLWGNK